MTIQGISCQNSEGDFLDKFGILLYNYILHHHGQIYAKFSYPSYHNSREKARASVICSESHEDAREILCFFHAAAVNI